MILAIDLGSTSFKAGVFDHRLRLRRAGRAPVRYHYGPGGRVELRDVATTLRRALPDLRGVASIAITSQAQTFTAAGRPFISWQDGRAVAAAAKLKRRLPDFAEHCSFAEVWPALLVSQLHHAPVPRGAGVLPLPTFFVNEWIGEPVIDNNLAAMTGLYSLKLRDWWPVVTGGIKLPRVIPIGGVAGLTRRNRFGLPVGVPVVLAGNDQTAGAYGARLEENDADLITLGTAQVVYRCARRLPRPAPGCVRGPYPGGRGYRLVADAWGGNLITWAKTVLAGCATEDDFFRQVARAQAGCGGLEFDAEHGLWRGLALHHTSAEMARSILETLSARLAGALRALGPAPARRLLVAGGGARRAIWRRVVADELGCPLQSTPVGPLHGAARMAAVSG